MNIEEKKRILLEKLSEKENLVCKYDKLMGPGLLRKMKRLILFREKYFNYCLVRIGILKNKKVTGKTFWGKEINLLLVDNAASHLYFLGILQLEELPLTRFLIKDFKEDDIFYDVGANYGFYSLLANELVTKGEIHAFEPHPKIFPYLKKIFLQDEDRRVFLNDFGISNDNKTISLYDGLFINESGETTILKEVARMRHSPFFQEIEIKATTLDKYTETHFFPTFIKLDIEGGEAKAIEGAYNTLTKHSPIIAMEVWRGGDGEKFSSKAVNLLYKLGYKSYAISEDGEITAMPEINFNQIKKGFENFIFKK